MSFLFFVSPVGPHSSRLPREVKGARRVCIFKCFSSLSYSMSVYARVSGLRACPGRVNQFFKYFIKNVDPAPTLSSARRTNYIDCFINSRHRSLSACTVNNAFAWKILAISTSVFIIIKSVLNCAHMHRQRSPYGCILYCIRLLRTTPRRDLLFCARRTGAGLIYIIRCKCRDSLLRTCSHNFCN